MRTNYKFDRTEGLTTQTPLLRKEGLGVVDIGSLIKGYRRTILCQIFEDFCLRKSKVLLSIKNNG